MNNILPNTHFFQGVVEDVNDPKKIGRARVRIFGIHTDVINRTNIQGIKTSDLPWAYVGQPVTSAAVNGIGRNHELVNGSWVYGFTRDDENFQDLIIMGTIASVPTSVADITKGFNDPDGVYPKADFVGESDVNRLARNESINKTIVKTKKDNIERNVNTASGTTWSEPITPYSASYPKNHVYESESGHITEVDDTPSAERTHEYHRAGTFKEVHPDGSRVEKIVGDDFEITVKNKKVLIKGNCSITILGNAEVLVVGDETRTIEGDLVETVNGSVTRTVSGDITETCSSNKTSTTSGTDTVIAQEILLN